jgi:hypothetical protein
MWDVEAVPGMQRSMAQQKTGSLEENKTQGL